MPEAVQLSAVDIAGALLALGLLVALLVLLIDTLRTGIAPMPSTARVRARMLGLVPPDVTGTLFELGSGWGTLSRAIADRFPDTRVVACEVSWVPFLWSALRQAVSRRHNLSLQHADLFDAALANASVVFCYLGPAAMERLAEKLRREAAPGTLVISNTFGLRGWPHDQVEQIDDLYHMRVYLYRVPDAVAASAAAGRGAWAWLRRASRSTVG